MTTMEDTITVREEEEVEEEVEGVKITSVTDMGEAEEATGVAGVNIMAMLTIFIMVVTEAIVEEEDWGEEVEVRMPNPEKDPLGQRSYKEKSNSHNKRKLQHNLRMKPHHSLLFLLVVDPTQHLKLKLKQKLKQVGNNQSNSQKNNEESSDYNNDKKLPLEQRQRQPQPKDKHKQISNIHKGKAKNLKKKNLLNPKEVLFVPLRRWYAFVHFLHSLHSLRSPFASFHPSSFLLATFTLFKKKRGRN